MTDTAAVDERIEAPEERECPCCAPMVLHDHDKPDCPRCAQVWAVLEADPNATEEVRQGHRDIRAGRWYRYDPETRTLVPNPDWPEDGPQPTPGMPA